MNKSTNKCWRGCGEKGPYCTVGGNADWCSHCGKRVWNFLRKLKMELLFDPAMSLLGLYPKNPVTPIQKNLCTPMFIATQFTIAKYWKQPKCPSVNEWIKKLWYIYNGILHSRKKEQAPTFCNSVEGTEEQYAK